MRKYYQVEGFEINHEMLEVARARCPGVPFHEGDMVFLELANRFDVVTCLFAAIGYVKSIENMYQSNSKMALHLNSNGLLIIEPWFYPENYWLGRVTTNFVDQPNLKIAWMYVSEKKL
ncbi:class I SAM-dependent methyltransferase [Chloroflexota bacterium]